MKPAAKWFGLLVFVAVCLAAAGLGAVVTTPEIEGWYRAIDKPSWNPASYVFGPVWTTLYVMMAVAAWLVWKRDGWKPAQGPLWLFVGQLVVNVSWSWVFFRYHQIGLALADLVVLWVLIAATMIGFFRRSRAAGWLLMPYLAWVTFAGALNFAIWRLNS